MSKIIKENLTVKSIDKDNGAIKELEKRNISVFEMIDNYQDEFKIDNNAHKPQK